MLTCYVTPVNEKAPVSPIQEYYYCIFAYTGLLNILALILVEVKVSSFDMLCAGKSYGGIGPNFRYRTLIRKQQNAVYTLFKNQY